MEITSSENHLSLESLVAQHIHIVNANARKIYLTLPQGYVDEEDLISEGVCALVAAAQKYDATKKETFSYYVKLKSRGAMIDFLRKQDLLSQQKRRLVKEYQKTFDELELSFGRKPTQDEVMKELNISKQEYNEIIQNLNASNLVYLDGCETDIMNTAFHVESTTSNLKEFLAEGLKSLTEREQILFQLYFYEDLNFREVAEILNISSARVSQLYSKGLKKLKKYMEESIEKYR